MVSEPSEVDLYFDAAGWWKNVTARRYELDFNGEVLAAVSFDEVRLAKKVDGDDTIDRAVEQAAVTLQDRLASLLSDESS